MIRDAKKMPRRNIKLTIEYDGTNFCGWQSQRSGRTVQNTIEQALQKVLGEEVSIKGSGRTDRGVHALAQVANFFTSSNISCERLLHALNFYLPDDVVITSVENVPESFDAQFDAKSKLYRYTILNRRYPTAIGRWSCTLVRTPLDVERMKAAAAYLVGRHDFRAFTTQARLKENTTRHITRLDVTKKDDYITIEVEADGFLYNMVRAIAGTLIYVGKGKLQPEDIKSILAARDRRKAGPVAPAKGLTLIRVNYGNRHGSNPVQNGSPARSPRPVSAEGKARNDPGITQDLISPES